MTGYYVSDWLSRKVGGEEEEEEEEGVSLLRLAIPPDMMACWSSQ